MFSSGFTSYSVLPLFPVYQSPSLCKIFNAISSNIDLALSINPSTDGFIFGDFNIHHKKWLNYSGGTDQKPTFSVVGRLLVSDFEKWGSEKNGCLGEFLPQIFACGEAYYVSCQKKTSKMKSWPILSKQPINVVDVIILRIFV